MWNLHLSFTIPIGLFLLILINIKKRGFFWKAKDGAQLTLKQFFKRWGQGIEGITARQQKFTQLLGTWIVITGILAGIIINLLIRLENTWWWLEIILTGSLIISLVQLVGTYQSYKRLKMIDEEMKNLKSVEDEIKNLG